MKSIFFFVPKLNLIYIFCLLIVILYIYNNFSITYNSEHFIPDIPSRNEFYIHRLKDKISKNPKKPKVKYFMAIPYGDNLVSKNNLWNMMRDCKGNKYLPKTYILENFYDNLKFQKEFNKNKIYILKKNIHRKQGLLIIKGNRDEINRKYLDGYKVIQEFINNPFLVEKRIVIFRSFMLAIRDKTHKHYFYIHKYVKCLYTPKKFSLDNLEIDRLITSNKSIINNKFPKTLNDMKDINLDIIKKPILEVVRCFSKFIKKLEETSYHDEFTFYQLFGVDIILDKNKNPFLLEINKNPDMKIYNKSDLGKKKIIFDTYNLIEKKHLGDFIKFD